MEAVVDRDVDAVVIKRWIKGSNRRLTVSIGQSRHTGSIGGRQAYISR